MATMTDQPQTASPPVVHTRGYQQELLQESLRRNIIIALDTGSGKTHIAMLRMKHEVERQKTKICWFLAPTVTLIEQQKAVIAAAIPVSVTLISGRSAPDQWKDAQLWAKCIAEHRIVVSTPQILLDALRHGYIRLGRDVSLLVFDEAHHATQKHPYNEIMKSFYVPLPLARSGTTVEEVRPGVLGLTASPIYGGDIGKSFSQIEANLDSVIRSSRLNRTELAMFVHRPVFKHVLYPPSNTSGTVSTGNLAALRSIFEHMNIENDPYVVSLRSQLAKLPPGEQRNRVDQKLSKTVLNKDTFTHKGLRDLERTATDLCIELGPWAADWYISKVLERVKDSASLHTGIMASWQAREKRYLHQLVTRIPVLPPSEQPDKIRAAISPKVSALISCLKSEERSFIAQGDVYSGLIFVTRRAAVVALAEILTRLPDLRERFRIGCLLGDSASFKRHSLLDLTRELLAQDASETLKDFRTGEKNIVVATAVAEEGLDIQACGSVIRFNPPENMVSWAQSRGRARKQRSTYIVMFGNDPTALSKLATWEQMEKDMVTLYTDTNREQEDCDNAELEDPLEFRVESTGALLTLDSAIGHIHHFCSVLPHSGHGQLLPFFDLDPPDMEEEWHSLDPQPGQKAYQGPWGATCTLPRQVPVGLRVFATSPVYPSKRSARNHAAFFAYHALYQAGLLNDHLLPLTSVIQPDEDGAVKLLLQEVEQRAGLANVPVQMDPWLVPQSETRWWYNEVFIEGLPDLYMFTRCPLPDLASDELPILYVPGQGQREVKVHSCSHEVEEEESIAAAVEYTRRMFFSLHYAKMESSKTDFCYLFLPMTESQNDVAMKERREWQRKRLEYGNAARMENATRTNAEVLGKAFDYPLNVGLVRSNEKFDKVLQFVGWHYGPISSEDEEELWEKYDGFPDVNIVFPLLCAIPFPRRANFLIPLDSPQDGLRNDQPFVLLPKYATIDLVTYEEVQFAFQLPSVLRFLSIAITVHDMRRTLFASSTHLSSIPFNSLRVAITAPVSQEATNYQRLETLGDTVLKYIVSIQLFSQYPLWHEGYLSRRKDHAVNNNRLAKEAIRLGLEKWIIRDRFVPRKWRPRYVHEPPPAVQAANPTEQSNSTGKAENADEEVDADAQEKLQLPKRKKKQTQQLSTKMLADVVESLIGAAYEHGSFDLAIDCAQVFGLGLTRWDKIPQSVEVALSRVEHVNDLPGTLANVEQMLGYQFLRPVLLVEALTHASYTGDIVETVSYERLEFLGDAALDMIVTDFLYHAEGKNYGPGHMHIRKESLVNSHLLAYLCLKTFLVIDASMPAWNEQQGIFLTANTQRIHLHQCLLHSSTFVLDHLNITFARYEKNGDSIKNALERDSMYPWAALTSLQAPKFISDLVESLLGAVFLDSDGNLDTVRGVLTTLGHTQLMQRIVNDDVDVLHPVSRLSIWAAKNERKCKILTERADGEVSCAVFIDDVEEFRATEKFRGKASQNEVRFAAAEGAIRRLHVIEQEELEDADEVEWGDVPEYIV